MAIIRSKYLGKTFDNNWVCVDVGLANVQGKKKKAPGRRNYYYIFERRTSDNKADKTIRLNSSEAVKVYRGQLSVESLADKRAEKQAVTDMSCRRKVNYNFGK